MLRADDIRIKQLNPAAEAGNMELVKKLIQDYKALNLKPNPLYHL